MTFGRCVISRMIIGQSKRSQARGAVVRIVALPADFHMFSEGRLLESYVIS